MTKFVSYWIVPERIQKGDPVLILITGDTGRILTGHCLCQKGYDWMMYSGTSDGARFGGCQERCPYNDGESIYELPQGATRVCMLQFGTFNMGEVLGLIREVIRDADFDISAEEIHIDLLKKFAAARIKDWFDDTSEQLIDPLAHPSSTLALGL